MLADALMNTTPWDYWEPLGAAGGAPCSILCVHGCHTRGAGTLTHKPLSSALAVGCPPVGSLALMRCCFAPRRLRTCTQLRASIAKREGERASQLTFVPMADRKGRAKRVGRLPKPAALEARTLLEGVLTADPDHEGACAGGGGVGAHGAHGGDGVHVLLSGDTGPLEFRLLWFQLHSC